MAAAFAGFLVNPFGFEVYVMLAAHAAEAGRLSVVIQEWYRADPRNAYLYPFWGTLLAAAVVFAARLRSGRSVPAEGLRADICRYRAENGPDAEGERLLAFLGKTCL